MSCKWWTEEGLIGHCETNASSLPHSSKAVPNWHVCGEGEKKSPPLTPVPGSKNVLNLT